MCDFLQERTVRAALTWCVFDGRRNLSSRETMQTPNRKAVPVLELGEHYTMTFHPQISTDLVVLTVKKNVL